MLPFRTLHDTSVTEDELHGGLEREFFPPQIEELAEIHPKNIGREEPIPWVRLVYVPMHNLAAGSS